MLVKSYVRNLCTIVAHKKRELVVTSNQNHWINILINIIEIFNKIKEINTAEIEKLITTLTKVKLPFYVFQEFLSPSS